MKIGVVKLGKSTYWDPESWKWIGADIEVRLLCLILAERGHDVHFWGAYQAKDPGSLPVTLHDTYSSDSLDELVADVGQSGVESLIVVNGPVSKKNAGGIMMMRRYTWPGLYLVNKTDVPWHYLYSDPRYFIKAKELEVSPSTILAQTPGEFIHQTHNKFPVTQSYFDVSAFWRHGRVLPEPHQFKPERKVIVIGNAKPGHQQIWDDCAKHLDAAGIPWEVWGVWQDSPDDPRYMMKPLSSGRSDLANASHLVVIGTKAPVHGGYPFTGRWWEVAESNRIVMVNSEYDYTGQRVPLDAVSRFANGADLVEKVKSTYDSDWLYQQTLDWQRSQFDPSHASSDYLGSMLEWYMSNQGSMRAFDPSVLTPETEDIAIEKADGLDYGGKMIKGSPAMISMCTSPSLKVVKHLLEKDGSASHREVCEILARTDAARCNPKFDLEVSVNRVFQRLEARGGVLSDDDLTWSAETVRTDAEAVDPKHRTTNAKSTRSISRSGKSKEKQLETIAHRCLDLPGGMLVEHSLESVKRLVKARRAFEVDIRYDHVAYYLSHDEQNDADHMLYPNIVKEVIHSSPVPHPLCWMNVKQPGTDVVGLNLSVPAAHRAKFVYFDFELVENGWLQSLVAKHGADMPRFAIRASDYEQSPDIGLLRPCDFLWLDFFDNPWWWISQSSIDESKNVVLVGADCHKDRVGNWQEVLAYQRLLCLDRSWKLITDYPQ